MNDITFEALEYQADQTFAAARYRLTGSVDDGWQVERDGRPHLRLGPGYRALRMRQCGVCSTDLARHFLPFPLPQVIGHEVLAEDEQARRYVVEINASHAARGVADECVFCREGLPTHCPERVVLGIDRLPGGFGPWILAPVGACLEVPAAVSDRDAVVLEPLAAALHAVTSVAPRAGERIAVLGPRRLGMLVVACLAAVGGGHRVAAVLRNPRLAALATDFGADEVHVIGDGDLGELAASFDVVIDTTGSPQGLERAIALARREVHLKSTHGQPAVGLHHLTELVVDELTIAPFDAGLAGARVAWLAESAPGRDFATANELQAGAARELVDAFGHATRLPRADVAVVDSLATVDAAIRPVAGREQPLVRPRGRILVHPDTADASSSPLLDAVLRRGLQLSSSRCGDFRQALKMLVDTDLAGVGDKLVTHRFAGHELRQAFDVARTRECIKAVVEHVT